MTTLPPLSEEQMELLLWVGICITKWSDVDRDLLRITCDALGTGSQRAAIVYLKTPTIDSRLTLLDELINCILDPLPKAKTKPTLLKQWSKVLESIRDLLPTRNKLAHCPVGTVFEDGSAHERPAILSSIGEVYRGKLASLAAPPILPDDMESHYSELESALKELMEFGRGFAKIARELKPSRRLSMLR